MNSKIIKLTNAAYKVLDFLPESDPLKNRAKGKVLEIMSALGGSVLGREDGGDWLSMKEYFSVEKPARNGFAIGDAGGEKKKLQALEDIDVFLGYLEIGKAQGWISGINFFIISNEYEKLKKEISLNPEPTKNQNIQKVVLPPVEEPEKSEVQATQSVAEIAKKSPLIYTSRQMKIVDFLSKNSEAQVMDLQRVMPDVTKRTIRRDLDELLRAGRIVRLGEFNQVVYKLNQAEK
ncbi:MAG: DeoR family transcriptional regulator [Candidatus Staskawiczbacteria bacterium]|nr:DeoR family transcriptional regulator [Candidatus Staskawiczbacteria bacterium]